MCPVQAPGYFSVIQNPMDFKTMRQKLTRGEYQSWDALQVGLLSRKYLCNDWRYVPAAQAPMSGSSLWLTHHRLLCMLLCPGL